MSLLHVELLLTGSGQGTKVMETVCACFYTMNIYFQTQVIEYGSTLLQLYP